MRWYDASELTIEGKAWENTKGFYHRLPEGVENFVNERLWKLSMCPSGMSVHFSTKSSSLSVKWDGAADTAGFSGVDLYVRHEGEWRWLSVGSPSSQEINERCLFEGLSEEERDYMLYLPLFHQLQKLEIGIPDNFELKATKPRKANPIVFYGTSITQGSRASRAGMCYSAILGRRLDTPVINLGFSGNGDMAPNVIELLCEIDPEVYVLDCLPNMWASDIKERLEPAVKKLRDTRPDVPVILVEMFYCDAFLKRDRSERYKNSNKTQHEIYKKLIREGVGNLHYIKGENLIGTDGEATIDGTHYTDVGYMRYSDKLFKPLSKLIG